MSAFQTQSETGVIMTDLRKAAERALEALAWGEVEDAKVALSKALATQVTLEVAKRKTLAELLSATPIDAIEAKLKERNT